MECYRSFDCVGGVSERVGRQVDVFCWSIGSFRVSWWPRAALYSALGFVGQTPALHRQWCHAKSGHATAPAAVHARRPEDDVLRLARHGHVLLEPALVLHEPRAAGSRSRRLLPMRSSDSSGCASARNTSLDCELVANSEPVKAPFDCSSAVWRRLPVQNIQSTEARKPRWLTRPSNAFCSRCFTY